MVSSPIYPFRISPLSNITPFTYADGETYLSVLEQLKDYINNSLRNEFSSDIQSIIDQFNASMATNADTYTAFTDSINAIVAAINNKSGNVEIQRYTLTGPYTLTIDPTWPTNQPVNVVLTQDATGNHALTLAAGIGGTVAVAQAPGAVTSLTLTPAGDGTWIAATLDGDLAATVNDASSATRAALKTVNDGLYLTLTAAAAYLTATDAAATYLTVADATAGYLDKTDAAGTYLAKTDAAGTYQTTAADAATMAGYPARDEALGLRYPEKRSRPRGGKTAFIGDSYTMGLELADPTTRWTTVYAAAAGFTELNLGVSSAGWVNEGITGTSRFAEQAQQVTADCTRVIICGGINDTSFTASAVAAAVTETIGVVRSKAPNAQIIVISPMWWNGIPSDGLMTTDAAIRGAIPAGVRYIEGAAWIRYGRADAQVSDGHPNPTGGKIIAGWVQAKIEGTGGGGTLYGEWDTPGTTDSIQGGGASQINLGPFTIRNARAGLWEIRSYMTLYADAPTDGFFFVSGGEVGNVITATNRAGVDSSVPRLHEYRRRVRHVGNGDMPVNFGLTPNAPVHIINGPNSTWCEAEWIKD